MLPILYLILIGKNGSPYPEVTVVSLPSSLMIVHSNAFVFSTCLLGVVFRYGLFSLILSVIIFLVYLKDKTNLDFFFSIIIFLVYLKGKKKIRY